MKTPITSIFSKFAGEYLKNNSATIEQHKAINSIIACKTGELGYHTQACKSCASIQTYYNSCGNRHCPNCQTVNKDKWLLNRKNDTLPVTYHHAVFTVPSELRTLFKFNKKLLYDLLFKVVWETIQDFSRCSKNRIEAEMGMIAILHTWKQNLDYHPHLHCVIPAGGITKNNKWKSSPVNGEYLFNVEALGLTFKGKFLFYLKKYYKNGELKFWDLQGQSASKYFYSLKEALYDKEWVVYTKESFKNERAVFEYLGRYTHKIAISNYRIKEVGDKTVTFSYTDRADNYKTKTRTVDGAKFIKLYLQHVLPQRFMKIRNYGFLSSRSKTSKLGKLFDYFKLGSYSKPVKLTVAQLLKVIYGVNINVCKVCGGEMVTVEWRQRPMGRDSPAKSIGNKLA